MNKNEVYKSLGVIEAYIMMLEDRLNIATKEYVSEHLMALQDWVENSESVDKTNDRILVNDHVLDGLPAFKAGETVFECKHTFLNTGKALMVCCKCGIATDNPSYCKVNHGEHVYYGDKCDLCGKVKDE